MPKFLRVGNELINLDHVLKFVINEKSVLIVFSLREYLVPGTNLDRYHHDYKEMLVTGNDQLRLRQWLEFEVYSI